VKIRGIPPKSTLKVRIVLLFIEMFFEIFIMTESSEQTQAFDIVRRKINLKSFEAAPGALEE